MSFQTQPNKFVETSRQNTSTTTGNSRGASIGISSSGVPNSVNVNASRTNGNRSFVDNQSSFIVGEGRKQRNCLKIV